MRSGQEEYVFGANAREVDTANSIFVWSRAQQAAPPQQTISNEVDGFVKFGDVFRVAILCAVVWVVYAGLEAWKEHSRSISGDGQQ